MIIGLDFNNKERFILDLALARLYSFNYFPGCSREEVEVLREKLRNAEEYASQFHGDYVHATDDSIYFMNRLRNLTPEAIAEIKARMAELEPYPDPFKKRSCALNDDDLNDDE